jgi:hypothetical protein
MLDRINCWPLNLLIKYHRALVIIMTRDDDDGSRCPVIINFCATTMNE